MNTSIVKVYFRFECMSSPFGDNRACGGGGTQIPFTDLKSNAHFMTFQRGQNAHYVPSL